MKKLLFAFTLLLFHSYTLISAADQNYAVWFSPVRSPNLWRAGNNFQYLVDQKNMLDIYQIPNTWLIQYDVFSHQNLIDIIKNSKSSDEIGLFLEISKDWAWDSFVNYDYLSEKWERADKLFLSGYRLPDRLKLLDTAMSKFKRTFGYYPKTVGAWHIDGYSLRYLQSKYQITSVLGLADQYLTDGYQVWGQYLGEPYYPDTRAVIEPAELPDTKLNLVKFQWAPRHPLLGYGIGSEYSNYSAQLNDYFRDKRLPPTYFSQILDIYTKNISAPLAQITLGIEVGELDFTYKSAFELQLQTLIKSQLNLASASAFSSLYQKIYPNLSPDLSIKATDSGNTIKWIMTPNYRLGVLKDQIIDLHWYHQSYDFDQYSADQRQNLYQVVPAEIDSISLGNSASFSGLIRRPPLPTPIVPKIKHNLLTYLPDLRYSKIGKSLIFGFRIDPEHLLGIQFFPFKIGQFYYPFPYLESFINLDKYRLPHTSLPTPPAPNAIYKNAPYGIENLKKELLIPKLYENSLYLIPQK